MGYFKVVFGTGLKGDVPCHCPYCGHTDDHSAFFTQEQKDYAASLVFRKAFGAIAKDLKALEFEHKPSGPFGIGLSMTVKPGAPPPIRYYRERELETRITCNHCTHQYAVYGVFAYCPDCGRHNSLQILHNNFDVVEKLLRLAASQVEEDVRARIMENALEDCVSSFDGYGRELCKVNANLATKPKSAEELSFQNLEGAAAKCKELFSLDLKAMLPDTEWDKCLGLFAKRHLYAHKMGVADERYTEKVNEQWHLKGKKVTTNTDEVSSLMKWLKTIAGGMTQHFEATTH
jgi:hypothetical protein